MSELKIKKSGLPDGFSGQAVDMGEVYLCDAPHCPLNRPKQPGHFTGGLGVGLSDEDAKQAAFNITGEEDGPYGEGVCPSCGTPGTPTGERHLSSIAEGDTPSVHPPDPGHEPTTHEKEG